MNAAELIYKMTILPILTYSSTIKTSFTRTQLLKFSSIERRASTIIGKPVDKISKTMEQNTLTMVRKCVRHEFNHAILDNYFEIHNHGKKSRNDGLVFKVPKIKLEIARSSYYFGGIKIFNNLPLEDRKCVFV